MKTKNTFKVLGIILAVVVILSGGIGLTGVAAQSAIPGDALYSVKTTIENTRLSLAQDAGDRAQMKLAFAEQRLSEITSLVREGRYTEIREAVLAFEANINAAIMELETVSAADPARAAAITKEVTSALTRYAQTLSELAVVAPDSVKPEVTRALDTTQIASGLGQINGNENANDNGSIDDNANANSNDNSSVNDNANVNTNDNSAVDDNSNDNDNTNVNGDDNSNSNTNAADNVNDDNSNANVNDSVGGGADDNANEGVDDNSNSNDNGSIDDNGNDNSNDNGDDDSSGRGSGSDDNGNDDNSGSGGSDDGGNSGKGGGEDD